MIKELTNYQKTQSMLSRPEMTQKLTSMLGEKKVEGFKVSVLNIMKNNSMLKDAEPNSVLFAAATAASLDLPVNENLGYAYIVPFRDNKEGVVKAQFQIGYKGFKQLAIRSGKFTHIHETDVREGEIESRDFLTGEILFNWIQDPKERLSKKIVGYVSFFKLTEGFSSTLYMSMEEIQEHAKSYSQTYKKGYGVWKDKFDSMAKKTVTKLNLSKNAPLSIESIKTAVNSDQAVIEDVDHTELDANYLDNPNTKPSKKEAVSSQMDEIEKKVAKPKEEEKKPEPTEDAQHEEMGAVNEGLAKLYELATSSDAPRKVMEKKPIWDEIKKLGVDSKTVNEHLKSKGSKFEGMDDLTKEGSAEDIISVIQELI